MRMTSWLGTLAVIAFCIAAGTIYRSSKLKGNTGSKTTHVTLIGASIGQGWQLAEWPTRAPAPGFTAEAIAAWQFDKTEAVEETLMRPATKFRLTRTYLKSVFQPPPKADIVILKECSAYFPGNLEVYKDSIRKWVRQIQASKLPVMLATVVPVTRARAAQAARSASAIANGRTGSPG